MALRSVLQAVHAAGTQVFASSPVGSKGERFQRSLAGAIQSFPGHQILTSEEGVLSGAQRTHGSSPALHHNRPRAGGRLLALLGPRGRRLSRQY
jgi:hypothetical protein